MASSISLQDTAMPIPHKGVMPIFLASVAVVAILGASVAAVGAQRTVFQAEHVASALASGDARVVPGGRSEGRIVYEWSGEFGVCGTDAVGRPTACRPYYQTN